MKKLRLNKAPEWKLPTTRTAEYLRSTLPGGLWSQCQLVCPEQFSCQNHEFIRFLEITFLKSDEFFCNKFKCELFVFKANADSFYSLYDRKTVSSSMGVFRFHCYSQPLFIFCLCGYHDENGPRGLLSTQSWTLRFERKQHLNNPFQSGQVRKGPRQVRRQ